MGIIGRDAYRPHGVLHASPWAIFELANRLTTLLHRAHSFIGRGRAERVVIWAPAPAPPPGNKAALHR